MALVVEPYLLQASRWPAAGRHILAQFDERSVVVYQAYKPSIGHFAAKNGYLGGEFSFNRMSWIKPNFLWMMYRCGWGSKEGQEVVLAMRLRRQAFDDILSRAVHSTSVPEVYGSRPGWEKAIAESEVRLQWDPDHAPNGQAQERRAIQLGLRGKTLRSYAKDWLLSIEDVSELVIEQRRHAVPPYDQLLTPAESVYPAADPETAMR